MGAGFIFDHPTTDISAVTGDVTINGIVPTAGGADANAFAVESAPDVAASATGTDAIAIADGSASSGIGSIAIGVSSLAGTAADAIAIGRNADATGASAIAIGGSGTDGLSADATAANAVAIGQDSLAGNSQAIALGSSADATAVDSIAIGNNPLADATDAIAIGADADAGGVAAIALGDTADASGADAIALGRQALASSIGQFSRSSGVFAAAGDAQSIEFVCRGSTTNATPTNINPDGGTTNRMIVPVSTMWVFKIFAAVREDATGDSKAFAVQGAIKRNGTTTTTLVGATSDDVIGEDAGATTWTLAVTANDTDEALQIQVTGEASHTLRWIARVQIAQVSG